MNLQVVRFDDRAGVSPSERILFSHADLRKFVLVDGYTSGDYSLSPKMQHHADPIQELSE